MRLPTRRLLGYLVPLLLLAGLAALSVVRVPEGSVLLSGSTTLRRGLHLAPPWQPRVVLPLSADRILEPVHAASPDGVPLSLLAHVHVATDPTALDLDASAIREAGGLDPYLTVRVGESVTRTFASRQGSDPLLAELRSLAEAAVARDLSGHGLQISAVRLEVVETDELRRYRQGLLRRSGSGVVVVVGLDGADWQVIDPLLERGALPALASLLKRGVRANLRSNDPMLSPLLWTTVATGKSPDEHGIMDFLLVDPETGKRVPMSSQFRRVKALWNMLTDAGMRSAFVAWWATWPAEVINGTMVTDRVSYSLFAGLGLDASESSAGLTFPPDYISEVQDLLTAPGEIDYEDVRRFQRIDRDEFHRGMSKLDAPPEAPPEDPVVALSRVLAAARTYHALALDLLEDQPDLLAVYYEGIDQIGHRFQHYMAPRLGSISDGEFQRFRDTVTSYYRYQDALLGELIEKADPDSVFLILSDHGFRNGSGRPREVAPYVSEKPGLWHRRYGIFVLAGPGVRNGQIDTVSLYDIAPTVLHLLGLPRAEDMRGRVLAEALEVDPPPGPRLATYEGFGVRSQAPTRTAAVSAIEEEMVRELTALGYVGPGAVAGEPDAPTGATSEAEGEARVTANYHLNLATILAGEQKFDEAEAEVVAALELAPLPDGYRILSQIRERRGDRDGAIEAMRQSLSAGGESRGPGDGGRLRLVGLLIDAGRLEEARLEAGRGFQDGAFARTARGLVAERDGNRVEAAGLYRLALEERPTLSAAMARLYGLVPPQELDGLEPLVRRALAENDQLATFHNVLGVILKRRGDLHGAIARYRRALAIEPDKVEYLANLAAAEMITGNLGEAMAVLQRALHKDPESAEVWLNLGSVHGKAGRPRESLEAYRRAEELGASGPGLAVGQALGHLMLEEVGTARQILAQARQKYPSDRALRELEASLP